MNWLIVEDALKDRYGHWLEFVVTFRDGAADRADVAFERIRHNNANSLAMQSSGERQCLRKASQCQ